MKHTGKNSRVHQIYVLHYIVNKSTNSILYEMVICTCIVSILIEQRAFVDWPQGFGYQWFLRLWIEQFAMQMPVNHHQFNMKLDASFEF